MVGVKDHPANEFSNLGDDSVSEGVEGISHHPLGKPMSHATHVGFR